MTSSNPTGAAEFPPIDPKTWRKRVESELKGTPFGKALVTQTPEQIAVQPVYTAADWPHTGDPSGFPGLWPFTRGARPLATAAGWQRCQCYDHSGPAELNEVISADLAGGANAVCLRLDRATRLGLDPPDDGATTHLLQGGASVSAVADLDRAFDGVEIEEVALTMDAGANALPVAATLLALVRRRGVDPAKVHLSFDADPLGALARDGMLPMSLQAAEREMALLAAYCRDALPCARAVAVSTVPYHGAGAHSVQELAYAMATGVHYLRCMTARGLSIAEAAAQIAFSFAVGRDFFIEIAKLRAARSIWARVLAACNVGDVPPAWLRAVTSPRTLTRRDPWVNMLRVTEQTFAALAGGADSITSSSFDEALGEPGSLGRRVARSTQIILSEESHIGNVIDPAGGSWYVESLTDQLSRAAWSLFQDIEQQGGMAESVLAGAVRKQVDESWAARSRDVARRTEPITGVSEYANITEELPARPSGLDVEAVARARQRAVQHRDSRGSVQSLAAVPSAAQGRVVPACIAAAGDGATVGELSRALPRDAPPPQIAPCAKHREGEMFEALRDAADVIAERVGRPKVFLATLGPVPEHKARAIFAQNFFQAAGIEVIEGDGTADAGAREAAAMLGRRYASSGAPVACVCGSDARYAEMAVASARALKAAGARRVLLAGRPGTLEESLAAAGVNSFLFMGCDAHHVLSELLADLDKC